MSALRVRGVACLLVAFLTGVGSAAAQDGGARSGAARDAAATAGAERDAAAPIAAWSRSEALSETRGSLRERGAAVFNNWCSACHSRGLQNAPGTQSLQYKYRGEIPAALEDRTDLTPELVAFYVRNGVATMPFFRPTEISDADLDALAAYLAKD